MVNVLAVCQAAGNEGAGPATEQTDQPAEKPSHESRTPVRYSGGYHGTTVRTLQRTRMRTKRDVLNYNRLLTLWID